MSTVEEIKTAIDKLPKSKRIALKRWLAEENDDNWDRQIDRDSASGKLDALFSRAEADIGDGRTKKIP